MPEGQKSTLADVTLYSLALGPVSQKRFSQVCYEQEVIPGNVLIDIFSEVAEYEDGDIRALKDELSQLSVFVKLLQVKTNRDKLHQIFKVAINRDVKAAVYSDLIINVGNRGGSSCRHVVLGLVPARLAANFEEKAMKEIQDESRRDNLLKIGMQLGDFLCKAGWYEEGAKVMNQCMFVCLAENDLEGYQRSIKCIERLLMAQICYSMLPEARTTFETANVILKKLKDAEISVNLAGMYSAYASLSFLECHYNDSLEWSVKALEELKEVIHCTEPKAVVDILRQAAKSCVVRREFHKAELLIKEAVYLARDVFGSKSVKYADTLLDYGYYLLNRDSIQQAVAVYGECVAIRKTAYGRYNLMTAIALEDLSYALYVMQYSTGVFAEARRLSQKSLVVMEVLLPPNHLQLASVTRVKALILEEIAIDSHGTPIERDLLQEAETLHLQALKLSKQAYGEMNVQIAKHYGNLGRLYQSMQKYPDAEAMHIKAISIKEKLLGLYDYEVALSVGHLASLYNYDIKDFRKAEELHLRSISIGRRLFGDAYSGLEYDYRGLLHIYNVEGNQQKFEEYNITFTQWKLLRDLKAANGNDRAISDSQFSQPVQKVIADFFTMKWINTEN